MSDETRKSLGATVAALTRASAVTSLGRAVQSSSRTFKQLAELSESADRIQTGLTSLRVPTYDPADLSEAVADRHRREAERDAAILATRDAMVELAAGQRQLAVIQERTLLQIIGMAADIRNTSPWTRRGVVVAVAALAVTVGFGFAKYLYG